MNNKGFTLVELIATIALLAVIAVISFVSITEVINQSKISDCENTIRSIMSATKDYVSDNRYNIRVSGTKEYLDDVFEIKKTGSQKYIDINANNLISKDYLSSPIVDPFDNEVEIDPNNIKIRVYLQNDYTIGYTPLNSADNTNDILIKNNSGNEVKCDSKQW